MATLAHQRNYQMEATTNSNNNNNSGGGSNNSGSNDDMSQRKEKIIIQNQMFINLQQQQQQIADVQQQQQQQQQVVKRAPKKLTQPPAIFSTTSAALAANNDNRDATTTNNNSNNNNHDIANFIANSPTAATYVQAQLNNINGLNIQTTTDAHHQHHQLTAAASVPTSVAAVGTTLPIVTYNGNQYCVITHTGDITASTGGVDKPELLQLATDKEGKTNFILMQPTVSTATTIGLQNSAGDMVN